MGRLLAGLLLIVLVGLGGLYFAAGRTAPPTLTIDKPERLIGQSGTVEVTAGVPRDRLTALTSRSNRTAARHPCSVWTATHPASLRSIRTACASRGPSASTASRNSRPAARGSSSRRRASRSWDCARSRARSARTSRSASSRLASPWCRRTTTSTTADRRWSLYRVTPEDVQSGVRVGDIEYPGFPERRFAGFRRRPGGSRAESGVLRPAARSEAEDADGGVRAGRSGQRGADHLRRQRLREAVQAEPHPARRRVHQPGRAGNPGALARAETGGSRRRQRHAAGISHDQRRPSQDQQRPDRGARGQDVPVPAVEGPVRPARQLAGRGLRLRTIAPISTRARRSTGRSTSASISR